MTITPESLRREAMTDAARHAARQFAISGRLIALQPHQRGHIHDTFI